MGVDDVKVITEKIELEDLGITKRQQVRFFSLSLSLSLSLALSLSLSLSL